MKHLNRVIGIAAVLLVGTFVTHATASAQMGRDTNARASRIVGLWDVEVSVTNCSGVTVGEFLAMHKYEFGGTGQVVPAGNPTALSAHMMIWNHVGGNNYQMAIKMYRYNPAGEILGWTVLTNEIRINEAANEYAGSGVSEVFDADGNFLFALCPSFEGTRFTGAP